MCQLPEIRNENSNVFMQALMWNNQMQDTTSADPCAQTSSQSPLPPFYAHHHDYMAPFPPHALEKEGLLQSGQHSFTFIEKTTPQGHPNGLSDGMHFPLTQNLPTEPSPMQEPTSVSPLLELLSDFPTFPMCTSEDQDEGFLLPERTDPIDLIEPSLLTLYEEIFSRCLPGLARIEEYEEQNRLVATRGAPRAHVDTTVLTGDATNMSSIELQTPPRLDVLTPGFFKRNAACVSPSIESSVMSAKTCDGHSLLLGCGDQNHAQLLAHPSTGEGLLSLPQTQQPVDESKKQESRPIYFEAVAPIDDVKTSSKNTNTSSEEGSEKIVFLETCTAVSEDDANKQLNTSLPCQIPPFKPTEEGITREGRRLGNAVTSPPQQLSEEQHPTWCITSHKDYLKKHALRGRSSCKSMIKLFQDIRKRGYRGTIEEMNAYLIDLRKESAPSRISLELYKSYLIKRLEEMRPNRVSPSTLLQEIRERGYQGRAAVMESFLTQCKQQDAPQADLDPHYDYLIKRIEETPPDRLSLCQLFEEIKQRGYEGSINTVAAFMRKVHGHAPETRWNFHENYLIRKLKGSSHKQPAHILFKEIQNKGFRGSFESTRKLIGKLRKQALPPESYLKFHKDYINKRLRETQFLVSKRDLFTEIQVKGYRGAFSSVRKLVWELSQEHPC